MVGYSPLLSLPQELLEEVARELSSADRLHLSKACKELMLRMRKVLYSNISMSFTNVGDNFEYRKWMKIYEPTRRCGYRVVRTRWIDHLIYEILRDPELGSYVRKLELYVDKFHENKKKYCWNELLEASGINEEAKRALKYYVGTLDFLDHQRWERAIEEDDIRALAALVVWLCPNIVVLKLSTQLVWGEKFFFEIFSAINDGRAGSGFQNLSMVDIRHFCKMPQRIVNGKFHGDEDTQPYLPLLRSPKLRALRMNLSGNEVLGNGCMSSTTFPLTTLCIHRACVSLEWLGKFLKLLPCLISLYYGYQGEKKGIFYCPKLPQVLEPTRHQLRELRLGFGHYLYDYSDKAFGSRDIKLIHTCSLQNFSALTHLQLPIEVLIGRERYPWNQNIEFFTRTDMRTHVAEGKLQDRTNMFWASLPSNLERLVIRTDDHNVDKTRHKKCERWLDFLTRAFRYPGWRDLVPKLRWLDLTFPSHYRNDDQSEDCEKMVTQMQDLCAEHGIICQFVKIDDIVQSVDHEWMRA